ncbi:isochorismatase family cysteine hydrolase [Limobrevibacterium gyesilva]|uniref:Cysteine hydrolase n=1 Tax=Limobrevibacterium gyesilva TaxID=2991712 RepID=A0AA41YNB3_9PROT|nr:isochorismatase family cysteine hydrolase [Limobrevibacterium gyesilva]MCW3477059.1 cysteine hydrolase [Limobrevibacterium gyesilva]
MTHPTTRDLPVEPAHTTLLFIDVQNYCAVRNGGEFKDMTPEQFRHKLGWFFAEMEGRVVPNMQRLQAGCRAAGIEVMYTLIRNLTKDGRDRSLDYKITGFSVPPDSWDGQVIDAIAPGDDEMVIPKTSSNVFVSTNIDYVLRNLGTKYLVISGIVTDQCVEGAVRDACDLGYLVTLVTDACATYSAERHANSLQAIKGYCRQRTTDAFLAEISAGR